MKRQTRERIGSVVAALIVASLATMVVAATGPVPGDGPWLQYKEPGLGGFDAEKLEAVRLRADELGSGAIVVVRKGLVVAAWGDVERRFKCHSVRKSLLSALYGRAVADGKIALDATLGALGIDDIDPLSEVEKTATVEQLLMSRSGVYHPAAKEPRSMKDGRPARGSAKPGERFWYNNWDFNTAGHIYQKATGRGIFEAFREDLAAPLGMEDFRLEDGLYQYERSSSRVPAYAFRLSARDTARFGLLYLRDGKWDGRDLVPASWIERSLKTHTDLGDGNGYGYMWWTYGPGILESRPEATVYAARGTGGQLVALVPSLDLVIVHRADTDFGRGVDGTGVWSLVQGIVDAIDGDARLSRQLEPVRPRSFSRRLPALPDPERVELPTATLDRYVGRYRISPEITVQVDRMDDFLIGTMTGAGEADFFAIGERDFWAPAVGARVRFDLDEEGAVVGATLWFRGEEMRGAPIDGGSR